MNRFLKKINPLDYIVKRVLSRVLCYADRERIEDIISYETESLVRQRFHKDSIEQTTKEFFEKQLKDYLWNNHEKRKAFEEKIDQHIKNTFDTTYTIENSKVFQDKVKEIIEKNDSHLNRVISSLLDTDEIREVMVERIGNDLTENLISKIEQLK